MATSDQYLDLDGVSVRADTVRFDLLDQANTLIGTATPQGQAASIACDGNQSIKRKLSGVTLMGSDATAINPLRDRLRPVWVLPNGAEFLCGVFLFADASDRRYSYGLTRDASLVDQGLITGQPLATRLSWSAGTLVTDALRQTAEAAGIYAYSIDTSSATIGSAIAFEPGKANTYQKVLDYLAGFAGFFNPYFDNAGLLRARTIPDLASVTPTLVYAGGNAGRILAGSMVEANDLLSAPNRYIVVDTSGTSGAVSATYDVPSSAPHSIAQRGFVIPKWIEAPGVGNVDQALAVAQAAATQEPQAYQTVAFSSPADPRHDTWDVISYLGQTYIETSWKLKLAPGGPMEHTAQRVYL